MFQNEVPAISRALPKIVLQESDKEDKVILPRVLAEVNKTFGCWAGEMAQSFKARLATKNIGRFGC